MLTAVMQGKNHTTVTEFRYAIAFWLSRLPPPFDYRIPYLGDGFSVSIREDGKQCFDGVSCSWMRLQGGVWH